MASATTPPPPSLLRTPSTPRFGTFGDDYQPYSPRKSSRVAQRSRSTHTPPRQVSSGHNLRTTPQTAKKSSASTMLDTPTSPPTASKKRAPRALAESSGPRPGALDFHSTSLAASTLGLPTPTRKDKMDFPTAVVRNNGMLPTPAKTPTRRPDGKNPAFAGISRSLFTSRTDSMEDVMPTPRKKNRRNHTGFSLNSFQIEEDNEDIQIFTDSNDRVPEVDRSADNPFYGEGAASPPEPTKRTSKRRKVNLPGEGEQDVEDVKDREDGLAYVFRGKKVWRSHEKNDAGAPDETDDEDGGDLTRDLEIEHLGPVTRSSVKPRLLYPSQKQLEAREKRMQAEEEEEADTDIEEAVSIASRSPKKSLSFSLNETPTGQDKNLSTPKAPRFAASAITPPTTARATRSKKVDLRDSRSTPVEDSSEDDCPSTPMRGSSSAKTPPNRSPFNGWQRVKKESPKKRGGDPMTRGSTGKRARN